MGAGAQQGEAAADGAVVTDEAFRVFVYHCEGVPESCLQSKTLVQVTLTGSLDGNMVQAKTSTPDAEPSDAPFWDEAHHFIVRAPLRKHLTVTVRRASAGGVVSGVVETVEGTRDYEVAALRLRLKDLVADADGEVVGEHALLGAGGSCRLQLHLACA
mgnify:CR=1 FL=1